MRRMFSKNQIETMIQASGLYFYQIPCTITDSNNHLYDGSVIIAISKDSNLHIVADDELSSPIVVMEIEVADDEDTYEALSPQINWEYNLIVVEGADNIEIQSIRYDSIQKIL